MKLRAALLAVWLAGAVAACGGSGGSSSGEHGTPAPAPVQPPQSPAYEFPDFFPFLNGKSGSATALVRATGQVLATYTFEPYLAHWGDSTENWGLTTCNGEPWLTILGYSSPTVFWAVTNTRTTWDGVELVCDKGAPYAPVKLVPGKHRLLQWGRIAGERDYFWATEFTFGEHALNPCWPGPDPDRPVIWQTEVWQDRGGATSRGTIIGDPWLNDKPNDALQFVWDLRGAAGLGAGTLWHTTSSAGEWCLQSVTIQ